MLRATESPALNFVCDSPQDPHFVQSSELLTLVLWSAVNPAHFDVSGHSSMNNSWTRRDTDGDFHGGNCVNIASQIVKLASDIMTMLIRNE